MRFDENHNSGDCNSGSYNSGNYNSGDYNSSSYNSGSYNSGGYNSGGYNSGYCNSGYRNSGNHNSGDYNSGDYNSGDYNSGSYNSGDYNSGNYNSGDCNTAPNANGCFNTQTSKLLFFNEASDMTLEEWNASKAKHILNRINFRPSEWIGFEEMTDEEKENHPECKTTDGYLKKVDNTDCYTKWWELLSENDKDIIKNIPNFNNAIFEEITGIKIEN